MLDKIVYPWCEDEIFIISHIDIMIPHSFAVFMSRLPLAKSRRLLSSGKYSSNPLMSSDVSKFSKASSEHISLTTYLYRAVISDVQRHVLTPRPGSARPSAQ